MYVPRILEKSVYQSIKNNKVLILVGARQVGKTTLLKKIISDESGTLINLDIEVDRAKFESASKMSPDEALKFLGQGKILVIDEAHKDANVGRVVKGWYDFGVNKKIVLSGSSSLNLLGNFAESLAGRNEKLFLTPFLFEEIIKSQSWYHEKNILKEQTLSLINKLLIYGSYPDAIESDNSEKYLLNLASDILLRDLLQEGLVRSSNIIKKLLLLLAYQIGSEVSTSELSRKLEVSRLTVDKYLDLLEKIYVIFRLPSFSNNPRREISKSQKVYFWDVGIRNALINEFKMPDFRTDSGALWENFVIAEFAKQNLIKEKYENLYFWRTRDGSEVDLVIKSSERLKAYEIKWGGGKLKNIKAFKNKFGVEVELINTSNFIDKISI